MTNQTLLNQKLFFYENPIVRVVRVRVREMTELGILKAQLFGILKPLRR